MKQLFTIILICVTVFATAQVKDSTATKDSATKATSGKVEKLENAKVDTVGYSLQGAYADWDLLIKAITQPRDVTPNQVDALVMWIYQNRRFLIKPRSKK